MRPYICSSSNDECPSICSCGDENMDYEDDCGESCAARNDEVYCPHIGKKLKPCIPYFEYLMLKTLKENK